MRMRFPTLFSSHRSRGYGLIEALLVAIVVTIGIAGIYRFYQQVYAAEAAHQESQNTIEITNRIMKAYGPMANFGGISNEAIIAEGIVPPTMGVAGTDVITSAFGGGIVVESATIGGEEGRGFSITYTDVPRRVCSGLVTSVTRMQRYQSVLVGGQEVIVDGVLSEAVLAEACGENDQADVAFIFQRNELGTALDENEICEVVPPTQEERTVACAPGYTGSILERRTQSCPEYYGLPVWSDWQVVSNTCAVICVPDPSSPETRTQACPTGYVGSITQQRTSTCPAPTGLPVWGSWVEVNNTCALACVVPAPQERETVCDSGYLGSKTERRTATCPSPTGSPVWGSWTVVSSTCEVECVVPTPSTQSRWISTNRSCPTGYSGTVSYEYEQERYASCPQATGAPAWSDWENTGRERNENTSQCTSLCNPETQLEQWVQTTGACSAGYVGNKTWERQQTRTSYCPTGALNPVTSAWSDTGQIRNLEDNCLPAPCLIDAGTTRNWTSGSNACVGSLAAQSIPSGQTVSVTDNGQPSTGSAQFLCSFGSLSSAPVTGTASCNRTACTVPANTTFNWTVGGAGCNATSGASEQLVPAGSNFTILDNAEPNLGTGVFACVAGQVSVNSTASVSSTCTGSCPAKPADGSRVYAGCAAGQYGSWTQTYTWTSTAFPTCWTQTAWAPASAPPGACTTCPANTTETLTQWVDRTETCPTGYSGSITYEAEQSATRSVTYSCPAGTTTAPTPVYGTPTAWVDTGTRRNEVNTCTPNGCTIPAGTTRSWTVGGYTCTFTTGSVASIGSGATVSYADVLAPNVGSANFACNAGTLSATPNAGATCAPASCTISAGTTRTWTAGGNSCSATLATGTIAHGTNRSATDSGAPFTGTAAFACNNGTLATTANAGATCVRSHCAVPASTTYSWTISGASCSFTTPASVSYVANGSNYSATDSGAPTTGTGLFACVAGNVNINSTQAAGSTCVGACPAKPADGSRSFAGCAAGQYGSWTQTYTWTSAAYPTCWNQTAWSPATAPGGACTSCPANATLYNYRWVDRSQACPAGQTGSITWQAEQRQSYVRSYSCPAGTASLPAPTYGSYSAWSDTGNTRNTVNTCVASCTPTAVTRDHTYRQGPSSCGYLATGQYVYIIAEYQAMTTCPGPTQPTNPSSNIASVSPGSVSGFVVPNVLTTGTITSSMTTWPAWTKTGQCKNVFGQPSSCTWQNDLCTGGGGPID